MGRAQCEVADVFRTYWDTYARKTTATPMQIKVARDITNCRTAALGGHLYRCVGCSHIEQSYNSCRNRHCPKCQGSETARWVDERSADLLPVPYFHTVFTLPDHFNTLVLSNNKRLMYELLFRAVRETLLTLGKNNLGVTLGFFAVLHTWGQLMQLHPHVHCVIPACGVTPSGQVKVFNERFLLSDKALSAVFRGKFIELLKQAHREGCLKLPDTLPDKDSFEGLLAESCRSDWVVYSKAPFSGPEVVVKYLARYTHRVAIGNSRLVSIQDERVSFRYRDYKDGGNQKVTSLTANQFIRRFLLHIVPKGFVRIRHCGFLSHAKKRESLRRIRQELICQSRAATPPPVSNPHRVPKCPCCGGIIWVPCGEVPRLVNTLALAAQAPPSIESKTLVS